MAKLITKFKYIKPGKNVGNYLKYIATREGVDKIDDSKRYHHVTKKQEKIIENILQDFPDSAEMLEYEDYKKEMTIGAASEFITRAVEDNASSVMDRKTYADYIATRPRVQRFGSHGLFTDDGVEIKLSNISEELNLYEGNVWTGIISLRREDAVRLGFDCGERWRDMLRTQVPMLSECLKIPMENLKWFAAFHDESHHPHAHLMVYSSEASEGYLSKQGLMRLRSSLAKDIFAQELLSVYQKQTEYRDELKSASKENISAIIEKINTGCYDNPKTEDLIVKLAARLDKVKGKKVYGYLHSDIKDMVDAIIDEIAKDERIAALYDLWYEKKKEINRVYSQKEPEYIPLSRNKEFKAIKNIVIKEAISVSQEHNIDDFHDDDGQNEADELYQYGPLSEEPTESDSIVFNEKGRRPTHSWWTDEYKAARTFLYGTKDGKADLVQAFHLMKKEAAKGNGLAMHDLGKMYLLGLGCIRDEDIAQEWFRKALGAFMRRLQKEKNPGYMQYRIGKMYSLGYGTAQDYAKAAHWYNKSVSNDNLFAAYSLAGLYRRGQGVEQDDKKAFDLYTMAAKDKKSPNAYAMYELGRMFKDGIGKIREGRVPLHLYILEMQAGGAHHEIFALRRAMFHPHPVRGPAEFRRDDVAAGERRVRAFTQRFNAVQLRMFDGNAVRVPERRAAERRELGIPHREAVVVPKRIPQVEVAALHRHVAAFLQRAFAVGRAVERAVLHGDPVAAVERAFFIKGFVLNRHTGRSSCCGVAARAARAPLSF